MRRGGEHQARFIAERTLPYRLDQPRMRPNALGFVPESNLETQARAPTLGVVCYAC